MLLEFSQLEERDPRLSQKTTQVIGHLLRHQFLHVEDRGSAPMLETLQRATSGKLVADYFDVAGYRLIVRDSEGWAGIIPDTERISPARMKLDETMLLLLLRRLWEEAVQQGNVQARGAVLITLNQAYDAYQEIVSLGRRPAIGISAFQELLANLERRAIVSLGLRDDDLLDMELTIRPIVAVLAGDDFVTALEQLLQRDAQLDDTLGSGSDAPVEEQDA